MISRAPMNRAERIDISRAPSGMEMLAAGWAIKAAVEAATGQGALIPRTAEVRRLSTLLAREQERFEAHRAELVRGQ